MDISVVTPQQAGSQTSLALSMLKKNAQADQTLVNALARSSSPTGSRGQNVDITV